MCMTLLAMRGWDDFVVWSHLAFAPAVVIALARGVYDALALISVMVFLSVWYHREAESNKLVAKIELCSTCTLFAYGIAQCFYAPGLAVLTPGAGNEDWQALQHTHGAAGGGSAGHCIWAQGVRRTRARR